MEAIDGEKLVKLSNSVRVLLDKLDSSEFVDNFRTTKLDDSLLKKLKKTLATVLVTLNDDADVKLRWLDTLKYTVLEVDSLLDEINTEALRCKVETQFETLPPTFQVLKNLSSSFKRFNRVINSKFQKLIERLEFLSSRGGHKVKLAVSNRYWNESFIYGKDPDIKKLKSLLLSEEDADDYDGVSKIRMISVVGMEGIGKTTLAKLLYNDPQVKDKFGVRGWAHVSKDFDIFTVLKTILESITSQTISNVNLNLQLLKWVNKTQRNDTSDVYPNLLLVTLQQILRTNSFLLVLDDVWDEKSVNWINLMDIFNVVETESRIIITTRDKRVALSMNKFHSVHYFSPQESENRWPEPTRHAFGAYNNQQQSNAAVALGDFLHTILSPHYMNDVLESNILESADHDIQSLLQLSYHYLSPPLKHCFLYCVSFPKKYIINKNRLVRLWIAEGFVESSTDLEKAAKKYFDELVSRSLMHPQSIGDKETNFVMHSLIYDLADTLVSSAYCINMDEHNIHDRVYNLSYNRGMYDSYSKFDKLYGFNGLRTFVALPLHVQSHLCLLSNKVVHDLLPTLKQLRVLSLSNYKSITEVPNSIGNLLYLRYLNFSHTKIERLPSEICKLYNLQFLLLAGCRRLIELPEDIGKLVNLIHLDVSDTALRELPVQIAKLKNLHTLSDFVVSKHNGGLKIAELGNFPHLHGKLSISQLENVNDPFEALQANMTMKEQIDGLTLEWDRGNIFSDSIVLEHLRPSTNLKSLTIKGYGGISFANWLGDSLFGNMVYLRISNCDYCLWLPPLGQLGNLKELIIEGMESVETIGIEFYGSDDSSFQPFPSLEILHFEDMQMWEEWNLIGGMTTKFPSLKTLSLSKCPKLRVGDIVDKFPYLTELELRECPLLVQSMPPSDCVFRPPRFPVGSLQRLTIDGFPSPLSFPIDGLPKTLKFLIISNCENLDFLPHEYLNSYTSLEELKISYSCNSMRSFTLGALPVLKSLFIEGCKNLKSILVAEDTSGKSLSFLRSIKIWDCNELESFPPGRLAAPNLVYIALWKCEKLHSLPEGMNSLTGLQEMEIDYLPNLQSFAIDDLPSNLQKLSVGSVGRIMWNTEPTWEHLTCLSVLRINGNDTVKSLMVPLLPASLVTLCIRGFNDKSIDGKWFQHLTSLQNLEIINAPKLKSLPKVGLPSSLSVLSISRCPLLEASLQRKRGKEWRKIAHIPSIIMDDELIT